MKLLTMTLLSPLAVFGLLSAAQSSSIPPAGQYALATEAPIAGSLGVMTYNVHGLPWPFARGRDSAFGAIEQRLAAMRKYGTQPKIVVLQEAFTERAKEIGRNSGYRFIVNGPSASDVGVAIKGSNTSAFAASASAWKGETEGKLLDSGLQILSDYPVESVRSRAFSANACAGYDCLANKGVVLVQVRVPGQAAPLTIVSTHMNSKRASGVSVARSLEAYRRQAEEFSAFVKEARDPRSPMILAGDFNASSPDRKSLLASTGLGNLGFGVNWKANSGMAAILSQVPLAKSIGAQARFITKRGRDWQFFGSGKDVAIRPVGLRIPFGREADGTTLSDHLGFLIDYQLKSS